MILMLKNAGIRMTLAGLHTNSNGLPLPPQPDQRLPCRNEADNDERPFTVVGAA
jgi:hypothetical protein